MNSDADFQAELAALPKGTIVRRSIRGTERFYHQWRENGVTKSRYLSPGEIMPLRAQLARRKHLLASVPARTKGPVPTDFRCDILTGSFLAEYAAAANYGQKRDIFKDLYAFAHNDPGSVPAGSPRLAPQTPFLAGPCGVGKTTLLRQLLHALPPTARAKAAYLRLTGTETPADVTADLATLRNLGFRLVCIDEAHHLAGLAGTGLTLVLAGAFVPAALVGEVSPLDISFIPFREQARLTGEKDPAALIARGGTLGTDPTIVGTDPACVDGNRQKNDRFVLDVLALASLRAKDEARARGETFLGTDLQKLRNRFAEISALTGDEDVSTRVALLDVPLGWRYRHARTRIETLLADPILERLGAAERKIVHDLLMGELRLRLLEDAVWNELRHAHGGRTPVAVHRVPFAPGAYGFVVADPDELVCEVLVLTTDDVRESVHLRHLADPARLDALEHRYGTVMARTVLYNGRDARLASGVAYRNLAKYLASLR